MGFLRRGGALLGNTGWRRDVGNERLGAANRRMKPELQQSLSDKRNARREASDQSKQRKREEKVNKMSDSFVSVLRAKAARRNIHLFASRSCQVGTIKQTGISGCVAFLLTIWLIAESDRKTGPARRHFVHARAQRS